MSDNIFENASRAKVRFETNQGQLTTEQAWELSLTNLNSLAKAVNKQLKAEGEEDFIPTAANKRQQALTKQLQLKLDVLKHIIGVKVAEEETAKKRADRRAELSQLKELAANKTTEKLASESLESILQKIAALEAAEQ